VVEGGGYSQLTTTGQSETLPYFGLFPCKK